MRPFVGQPKALDLSVMTHYPASANGRYYSNPVFHGSFPDPFVIRWAGRFYAFATGRSPDGRIFPTLVSDDLVRWEAGEGALEPLAEAHPHYWAPEVTYRDGRFYLYYSVGNETLMELRVAVSDRPDGGFVDSGRRLSQEDFAIDAHVFRDDDGSDHLFYATDYLDHTHIGTGSAKVRLASPFETSGEPRPVTRARFDWQVYHPNRPEKGFVRWHTVEGPAVLKRKGIYYQMFSGGNWQNDSYGVSYAVTSDIDSPDEWEQVSDGVNTFPILRTVEGRIVGPGHNSVVRGPNGRELFCVYHEWIGGERVPAIDRLDFAGQRMFLIGPTDEPQPAPFEPLLIGDRTVGPGEEFREAVASDALIELYFACSNEDGVTFLFRSSSEPFHLHLKASNGELAASWPGGAIAGLSGFKFSDLHYMRADLMHRRLTVSIDGMRILDTCIDAAATELAGRAQTGILTCRAFTLTAGFEELFLDDRLGDRGWRSSNVRVVDGTAILHGEVSEAVLDRAVESGDFELCFNLSRATDAETTLTVTAGPELTFRSDERGWTVSAGDKHAHVDMTADEWRQVRLTLSDGRFALSCEGPHLISGECAPAAEIGFRLTGGEARLEMIRYTELRRNDDSA